MTRDRYRAGKRLWSPGDDAVMRRRYPHVRTATLARRLRRSVSSVYGRAALLGLQKTAAYNASPDACRLRRGDNVGARFRFTKGHVPANKGLRRPGWAPGRMRETQFKKGFRQRWMAVGSTRLVGGYVYVKVADVPNTVWTVNWLPLHVIEWERLHGPVPAGHCVAFTDGDRTHVDVDNLELRSRAANMARNTLWRTLPRPLAETVQLLGALHRQIRRRTHAEND